MCTTSNVYRDIIMPFKTGAMGIGGPVIYVHPGADMISTIGPLYIATASVMPDSTLQNTLTKKLSSGPAIKSYMHGPIKRFGNEPYIPLSIFNSDMLYVSLPSESLNSNIVKVYTRNKLATSGVRMYMHGPLNIMSLSVGGAASVMHRWV